MHTIITVVKYSNRTYKYNIVDNSVLIHSLYEVYMLLHHHKIIAASVLGVKCYPV